MFKTLLTRLGLNQLEKDSLGETVASIKDVSEYLSDIVEMARDSDYLEAVTNAAPWAGATVDALGEALPPVKFAVKLFESLTKEHDPEALGHLACTLAYQNSIEQTVIAMEVPIVSKKEVKDLKKQLADLEPSVNVSFKTFSFDSALAHDFVAKADRVLRVYAEAVGYNEEQTRRLIGGVHVRFVGELKTLLSHGSLKDRFEPFTILMGLGTSERQAYKALSEHAEYQRWLFEKAPVLKKEPYALANIYVNTECGSLSWGEISKPSEGSSQKPESYRNPFSEQWGGRKPLLETVIELLADPNFRDAIVIQGAAGAGKSSFTLKLCSELLRQGLRPIRVRLKDLRLDLHISEALPGAVRLGDEDYSPEGSHLATDDLFLGGSIFKEAVEFRRAKICPYVLILDGWDEISIAANEGFKVRIAKLLDEVRSEYLKDPKVLIRIILTGRPSTDVSESKFFRDKTRLLTIRALNPEALQSFVEALKLALERRPIHVDEGSVWAIDVDTFEPVLDTYKADFEATIAADEQVGVSKIWESPTQPSSGSLAVLGLPLLAHLAIRLIAQWPGDPVEIIRNPTTLYRSLVDLTSQQSGKAPDDASSTDGQLRLAGHTLRNLLWQTAAAMTIVGEESIPYAELELRLDLQGDSLYQTAADATKDNVLSSLMISFYFKGGQTQLGAEFVHKSFREYLFAEAIVQALKEHGREKLSFEERTAYWKEFRDDDARFVLSRKLSELLAPQWLTVEVATHLERLLNWEISRSNEPNMAKALGSPTSPLDLPGWMSVRDGLADVWDWWCEGVHLRPQPKKDESGIHNFVQPYVQELIKRSAPRDVQQKLKPQIPNRITTMDSHLGDGLFLLTALVHYLVATNSAWLQPTGETRSPSALWEGVSPVGSGPRKYQSIVRQGKRFWTLFAPSGADPDYFPNYVSRINAAGWRPRGSFPLGRNLAGVDLRGSTISMPLSTKASPTIWNHANLAGVSGTCSSFYKQDFREVFAMGANFRSAFLAGTNFQKAVLETAGFTRSCCVGATFDEAQLQGAAFNGADLDYATFRDADLRNADFSDARIYETNSFEGSQTEGAKLDLSMRIGASANGRY